MLKSRLVIASALVLAFAGNGWTESDLFAPSNRTGYWDFCIQTRYIDSREFEGRGGSHLSTENNLGWGFNAAYNINERLNVGFFAAWRSVDYDAHIVSSDLARSVDLSGWMDTANLGVNATVNLLKNRFTPYLHGGFGWAIVDTNIPATHDMDCWWDPWWGYVCTEYGANIGTDAASYILGAGLSLQLTDMLFFRVGYERNWIDVEGADSFDIVRLDIGFLHR